MSEIGGFLGKVAGVLTSPGKAFESIEEGDFMRGVALVLLAAVLTAWAGVLYTSKMDLTALAPSLGSSSRAGGFFGQGFQGTPSIDVETMRSRLMPFIAIGYGLGAFTRWLVPSLIILFIAKILVGEGSSKRALAMTGFAHAPMVAQQLLRVADAYRITSQELTVIVSSRLIATNLIGRILNQALSIFTVFGVATVVLTVFAVSTNYEATMKRAAAVTISSYLVYVLLRTYLPVI